MNERIHFKPCKKRIVGGSRYIHEESAVQNIIGKAALFAFDMAVFLVDLGRLGKSCKLLVDGLRDKDSGVLGPKGKRQDSTVFQKRDEIFISCPCAVEKNVVTERAQLFQYHFCIEEKPVVCGKLQAGKAERPLLLGKGRIDGCRLFPEEIRIKEGRVKRIYDAFPVSFRSQVYCSCTCLDEGALIRGFMVVPVKEDEIILGKKGRGTDPV